MDLTKLNDVQLAKLWRDAYKREEEMKRQWRETYGVIVKDIEQILTQRLHDSGATAINTPEGTIHTVGRTSAKIMDPLEFRSFVIEQRAWDMLDWKANMSACRTFIEENKTPVPGVELSTFRYLSITEPKAKTNVK